MHGLEACGLGLRIEGLDFGLAKNGIVCITANSLHNKLLSKWHISQITLS